MSFPLKSSMMFFSTLASYAGEGRIELCLRLSRLASDPGVVVPPSDIEPEPEAIEAEPSPRRGCVRCDRHYWCVCDGSGKQHGKTTLRKRSIVEFGNVEKVPFCFRIVFKKMRSG